MLNPVGKFLRKIRIDHDERLADMAEKLGVTAAYLSSIENGKRDIPSGWYEKISALYNLNPEEKKQFMKAVNQSHTKIKFNISRIPDKAGRELVLTFSSKFESLSTSEREELIKHLNSMGSFQRANDGKEKSIGYKVPPKSREEIEKTAKGIRAVTASNDTYFDIVHFLEITLPQILPDYTFSVCPNEELSECMAEMIPQHKEIRVREDVYKLAIEGNERCRFTLCHELGHLIQHGGLTIRSVQRVDNPSGFARKGKPYENSEWQADVFAGALLMPYEIINNMSSPYQIAQECGVSKQAANIQWEQNIKRRQQR